MPPDSGASDPALDFLIHRDEGGLIDAFLSEGAGLNNQGANGMIYPIIVVFRKVAPRINENVKEKLSQCE